MCVGLVACVGVLWCVCESCSVCGSSGVCVYLVCVCVGAVSYTHLTLPTNHRV